MFKRFSGRYQHQGQHSRSGWSDIAGVGGRERERERDNEKAITSSRSTQGIFVCKIYNRPTWRCQQCFILELGDNSTLDFIHCISKPYIQNQTPGMRPSSQRSNSGLKIKVSTPLLTNTVPSDPEQHPFKLFMKANANIVSPSIRIYELGAGFICKSE